MLQDDYRATSRLTLNLGLRYEFNTTTQAMDGIQSAFLGNFATDTHSDSRQPDHPKFFSEELEPENWVCLGRVWEREDVSKGRFRDILRHRNSAQCHATGHLRHAAAMPFCWALQAGSVLILPLDVYFPVPSGPGYYGAKIQGMNYYAKQPYLMQFNLGVEQQLPGSMALSVAYVGSRGIHLWGLRQTNNYIPTSVINGVNFWDPYAAAGAGLGGTNATTRVNPNWLSYYMEDAIGDSYYNSLQVGLTRRMTHGLQLQASYTYSKMIDTPKGCQLGAIPTAYTTHPGSM